MVKLAFVISKLLLKTDLLQTDRKKVKRQTERQSHKGTDSKHSLKSTDYCIGQRVGNLTLVVCAIQSWLLLTMTNAQEVILVLKGKVSQRKNNY